MTNVTETVVRRDSVEVQLSNGVHVLVTFYFDGKVGLHFSNINIEKNVGIEDQYGNGLKVTYERKPQ